VSRLRFVVYSDYLCPWCYSASSRLLALRDELGGSLELDWRAYLLRPSPGLARDPERFRAYTRSWLHVGQEPDAPTFRTWQGEAGPPSHSVPPHRVARAAASLGPEAFERVHTGLMRAYFEHSRDITDPATLGAIWVEAGLEAAELRRADDPQIERTIRQEHLDAVDRGITGVPTVRVDGDEAFVMGAQPVEVYRKWITRRLAEPS
jgi:predicted DsbA family dithiol-disulfide isomerase